jgi:hypothetical protein
MYRQYISQNSNLYIDDTSNIFLARIEILQIYARALFSIRNISHFFIIIIPFLRIFMAKLKMGTGMG